jgi:hypothetical protein
MKKRTALLTILAVILTAALGVTASAQEGTASAVGTGTLTAEGDGIIKLRGSGTVALTGNGVLKIRDCGGDAVIDVQGQGLHTVRRIRNCVQHKYVGFNGSATVTGRHIKVVARGRDLTLTASGKGGVILRGQGSYTIGDQTGRWAERGVEVFLPA